MKDLDLSGADFGNPGGWWPCMSIAITGDLDLHGVQAELRSVGLAGPVCVELAPLPPGSDEDRMVAESVAWLRESIRLMGWLTATLQAWKARSSRSVEQGPLTGDF